MKCMFCGDEYPDYDLAHVCSSGPYAPKNLNTIIEKPFEEQTLVERARNRALIRRNAKGRKSVEEGKRDRIADLLEELADRIESYDNLYKIIEEVNDQIGKSFIDNQTVSEWRFGGVVVAEDDYYYLMSRQGKTLLLSCVASLESHGFRLNQEETK